MGAEDSSFVAGEWIAYGREKEPQMNSYELAYRDQLIERQKIGEILWFRFEGITLRLAERTAYTPDFIVLNRFSAIECHEVKGFWRDDARVKIKVAAHMFPFRFIAVTRRTKKMGGGWDEEEF